MAVQISRSLLAASSWFANRLDVVTIGADNSLYHTSWNGSAWQSAWDELGGNFDGGFDPSMISWGPGRLDIFGLEAGSQGVIRTSWNGSLGWEGGWFALGGEFRSPVSVTSWAEGRLDLFSVGEENQHLWHQSGDGSHWQNVWDDLGGLTLGDVATASWGKDRLDVFALGLDTAMWHIGYGDNYGQGLNWQPEFQSLGGFFKSDPAVVAPEEGILNFFATGTDDAIYHGYWSRNAWSEDWESLQGNFLSKPAVVSRRPGIIELFAVGTDYAVWHNVLEGNWQGWNSLGGGPFKSVPVIVTRDENSIDLFAIADSDGSVWHSGRVGEDWGEGWHSLGIPNRCEAESSNTTSSDPDTTTSKLKRSLSECPGHGSSDYLGSDPVTIMISMGGTATGGTRGMPTEKPTESGSIPTTGSERDVGTTMSKPYMVGRKLIIITYSLVMFNLIF